MLHEQSIHYIVPNAVFINNHLRCVCYYTVHILLGRKMKRGLSAYDTYKTYKTRKAKSITNHSMLVVNHSKYLPNLLSRQIDELNCP